MKRFFTVTVTGVLLVLAGLLAGGIIVITNIVNGINNGWSGEVVGWILGAVLGFIVWGFSVTTACIFIDTGFFIPGAFTSITLIVAGFIALTGIVVTNVVNGINNNWDGTTVGWILGAVLGFIVWVPVVIISCYFTLGRK